MKGQADGRKKQAAAKADGAKCDNDAAEDCDSLACEYARSVDNCITAVDRLIKRIQKEGLAHLSGADFYQALEFLGRTDFNLLAEDFERLYALPPSDAVEEIKTPIELAAYRLNEYGNVQGQYYEKVGILIETIKEQLPHNVQAQQIANGISRLRNEVFEAIELAIERYDYGDGDKPQLRELLSDARHGALWDSVENAVAALSAVQAEKIAVKQEVKAEMLRAHKRGKEKTDAAAIRKEQREAAAQLIKSERDKGKVCSPKDAATNVFNADKRKGGYVSIGSLTKVLYIKAAKLGIYQFIDHSGKRGRKPKGKAKPSA